MIKRILALLSVPLGLLVITAFLLMTAVAAHATISSQEMPYAKAMLQCPEVQKTVTANYKADWDNSEVAAKGDFKTFYLHSSPQQAQRYHLVLAFQGGNGGSSTPLKWKGWSIERNSGNNIVMNLYYVHGATTRMIQIPKTEPTAIPIEIDTRSLPIPAPQLPVNVQVENSIPVSAH